MEEGDGANIWVKPQEGIIKVSVDAALFEEHSAFGFGIVARNSSGNLVLERTKLQFGLASPELVEVMAIKVTGRRNKTGRGLNWSQIVWLLSKQFEAGCQWFLPSG